MPKDLLPDVKDVSQAPEDLLPSVQDVRARQLPPVGSGELPPLPAGQTILQNIAASPLIGLLAGAESGTGEAIGNVLRAALRDIPTQRTRALAEDIARRQAATRQEFVPAGAIGRTGEIAGEIAPFLAAGPFAPEALGAEGAAPLLSRLGLSAVAGATQAPRQQLLGGALGLVGGGLGESLPALLRLGKKTVQGIGAASLAQPIREEFENVMGTLRKGVPGDNMNDLVFNKMKQAYEEIKGTKRVGNQEVPLNDSEYINRNPADSVHNLFAKAAELGDKNITSYDKDTWTKELNKEIEKNAADLERSPKNPSALEVNKELDVLANTRLNNFKDASELRKDINDAWVRGNNEQNRKLTNIVGPLKKAVDQSMTDSAAGDTTTLEALTAANNAFKNEQIPYEKIGKETSPFIDRYNGKKLTDKLIESYVRAGQPARLRLFMGQLPDEEARNLVAAHQFAKFEDNPKGFITAYGKLQQPERDLLLPAHRGRLDQLETLFKQHPSAFPSKSRIDRGLGEQVAKGLGVGLGGFGLERLVAGQPLEALALASPLITRSLIRGATKIPSIRERLFQSLVRQTGDIPRRTNLSTTLVPAASGGLLAQLLGGQQRG
jgi:hypothetical protein